MPTCTIKEGWYNEGRKGKVIGDSYTAPDGMVWTPVHWDDEEDPDWHKEHGLDIQWTDPDWLLKNQFKPLRK